MPLVTIIRNATRHDGSTWLFLRKEIGLLPDVKFLYGSWWVVKNDRPEGQVFDLPEEKSLRIHWQANNTEKIEGASLVEAISNYKYKGNVEVNAFGAYHPKRGGHNPSFDRFSAEILAVKDLKIGIIDAVYTALNQHFGSEFAIAVVPSHAVGRSTTGMKVLAELLCQYPKRANAVDCLVRYKEVQKAAYGGDRSKSVHLNSISVENPELISGKNVLLLDDVTTSNSSLIASKEILLASGASAVWPYALGQTV